MPIHFTYQVFFVRSDVTHIAQQHEVIAAAVRQTNKKPREAATSVLAWIVATSCALFYLMIIVTDAAIIVDQIRNIAWPNIRGALEGFGFI